MSDEPLDQPPTTPTDAVSTPDAIEGLDLDQLVSATSVPLPRAVLSRRVVALLWVVRLALLLLTALVVVIFVRGL